MAERKPLTDDEMVGILEDIARNPSNASARIAAIKQLREIESGEKPAAEGFEALDADDEVAARRKNRAQAA